MPLRIIPRRKWDLYPLPTNVHYLQGPVPWVMFMNTNTEACVSQKECVQVVSKLRSHHKDFQKLHDIRYNFLIGEDGNVYEGRGWKIAPWMPLTYASLHTSALLVAFIGPYTGRSLPMIMAESTADLISYGVANHFISKYFQYKNITK